MRKTQIDSILLVNWYFTSRKINKPASPSTELFRKYLINRIGKELIGRTKPQRLFPVVPTAFLIFALSILR